MVEASEISLTENERKLFDTLLTISKANNLKTTLRVAGGWVRDKVSDRLQIIFESFSVSKVMTSISHLMICTEKISPN